MEKKLLSSEYVGWRTRGSALDEGAAEERAKIVALMRKMAKAQEGNDPRFHASTLLNTVANAIECGEHEAKP